NGIKIVLYFNDPFSGQESATIQLASRSLPTLKHALNKLLLVQKNGPRACAGASSGILSWERTISLEMGRKESKTVSGNMEC
ncbi:MAG: hypothetical protein AAGC85_22650, partial [Bacteroidota bacterium]